MRRWRVVGLALIMGLLALTTLRAQRLPRPQIQAPRRDTTRRDTTGVDSAMAAKLRLSPPDSVMQALLRKSGYTVTRYEGDRVTFDAQNDLFQILGAASKRAIVRRHGRVLQSTHESRDGDRTDHRHARSRERSGGRRRPWET